MTTTLSVILSVIFFTLGFLYFYWSLGGKWGLKAALPTRKIGEETIEPSRIVTVILSIILISFGLFYLIKTGLINFQIPNWIITYGSWVIPSLFILRAIEGLNHIGISRKTKNTEFSKAYSIYFTPLCLTIGILGILIQLLK